MVSQQTIVADVTIGFNMNMFTDVYMMPNRHPHWRPKASTLAYVQICSIGKKTLLAGDK
jgi:hypothetical protein